MHMKKRADKKQNELLAIVYHLIVAIAIFSLVYVLNNFTHAQNPTIINDQTITTTNTQPVTYEDLSNKSYPMVLLQIKI